MGMIEKKTQILHSENLDNPNQERYMHPEIKTTHVQDFQKSFAKKPQLQVACNAVSKVGFEDAAMKQHVFTQVDHHFSEQIKNETKITNQKQSGRCWLFAGLNTMRLSLMKKYDLENFEFSQSYLFFWDKLEKANYFLENIIETREEELGGRLVSWLLKDPVCDGGQWDMFVNLIDKYGVIPQTAMQETHNSSNSRHMNFILTHKLREFAYILREEMPKNASVTKLREEKKEMLNQLYRILVVHLGEPPKKFDWNFRDKKKKFHSFKDLTPKQFLSKHVPFAYKDKVSIIHSPTKDKPYYHTFTVDYLGNVVGGKDLCYLNLPIEELKKLTIQSLKHQEAVWFGCDVGKHFNRKLGVMDTDLYDYENVFDMKLSFNKEHRLDYHDSVLTHAMVFTGVNLKNGKPDRWRVENSWGKDSGDKGYFLMSDAWFDEYMYEVVVDKKYLSEKAKKCLKQKPIVLNPWDPFGSLAQ